MYSSCGSDEILKEWAKNHAEAQDILLFTEGTLIDGSNMAHTLDDAMDHNVTIAFGVIEGKAEGGKVVGVFM